MREIIDSLFSSSPHHELYVGVIEAVAGIVREFPCDARKRKMLGDQAVYDDVVRAVRDAGLMGLGVDEKYGGMDEDTGMLSLWRSARALRIAPLNNEMILNYIARHGIGLPRSY